MTPIQAILFDKDGTLFDFQASWGAFTARMIARLADGDTALCQRMADGMALDLKPERFRPESPVIAGTADVMVGIVRDAFPGQSEATVRDRLAAATGSAEQVPVTPLAPLMAEFRKAGYRLGVATNDDAASAHSHLAQSSVAEAFDFVAGYDSGYGAKPGPGQLLGFAAALDLAPAAVLMVGDSTHDLLAAQAAGMPAIGVLTGVAASEDLAPLAEAVLPSIADLPEWLRGRKPTI